MPTGWNDTGLTIEMSAELRILRNAFLAGGSVITAAVLIYLILPPPGNIILVSGVFPLLLGLSGSAMAYGIFRRQSADRTGALIWGMMTIGLMCWTAGELIWAYSEIGGGVEVPYPSAADLLWVFGYLPLYFSIGRQAISLRASVPRRGRLAMAGILTGMSVLIVGLVVLPILASPESGTTVEVIFSLAYPIGDLVLLSLALALVMVFMGGQLALSWGVIAAGILLHAVSDLLFSYGEWNGIYHPGGQVNFLSAVFDLLYVSAYAIWNVGLFLRWRLPEPGKDVDLKAFIPEPGKNFLLLADRNGKVVFIDPALIPILGLKDPGEGLGKSFGLLIGLARGFENSAIRKASRTGISDDYTVSLGLSRTKYRLRAVASSDPAPSPGFDILIHPETGRPESDRDREAHLLGQVAGRAQEQKKAGGLSGEEEPLRVYFNTLVDLLFILIARAGGAGIGTAFERVLNEKARMIGCRFELRGGRAHWSERSTGPDAYRALLEEAVRYCRQVLSADTIERKLREIEKYMDPGIVREAQDARLRETERGVG